MLTLVLFKVRKAIEQSIVFVDTYGFKQIFNISAYSLAMGVLQQTCNLSVY